MPIYEYRCESCEHKLEKLQRMNDPALTDCPACGASALRRLVSAPGFRLKGGGWYETDFKEGNKRNLAESDSASDSSAATAPSSPAKAEPAVSAPPASGTAKSADSGTKSSSSSASDAA